jgi:hypothetical protein
VRAHTLLGVVLVALGVVALVWGGFTMTRKEKILDVGDFEATATRRERVPLPPWVGIVLTAGGVAILVAGQRKP